MERYLAIKTAARFLTRIYTDENNWDNSALAAILKAEGDEDTATLSEALDGVIAFCNELKGNLNADKRITKNGNEDERTRKELIEFVNANTLSIDERHSRWIAWLEKQKYTKEEMRKKAVEWIDYGNKNGGCLFDGWERSFIKYLEK